ncbi:hypothetical protein SAMN05216464_11317 [Mucilaginibacter pineti]|uniref:DUF4133 domain-containing protein n=1 Tax=Mucilaginibacter pineti TaxID=1391627 RepID=A0A1G7IGK0_9SPHI|nr:DUF4133 domain-containing protein [Mucilaginibacter pineti]SDF11654.1 hypothetical protein SAMN05216464_11317 [Mucilaginibacter pineti]
MAAIYPIYKGLERPLIYKGFKGKFIAWGIGSLIAGLISGGLLGALTSMYLGGIVMILVIVGGLFYTFQKQKDGLHDKTRRTGIFIHPVHLKITTHAKRQKNGI